MSERLTYVNGQIAPESRSFISVRDKGFVYGDAVFDTARTFGGKLFRLKEHVERLYDSLAYARIDPGMSREEMAAATEDLVARNLPMLPDGEDYWVTQRVTAGLQTMDGEPPANSGATVVIECTPIPLRARASFFRDGAPAAIPARRRVPPEALSPNVKSNNYLNMMIAQREVEATSPGAWALMLDRNGDVAEGPGCNYFVVKDGVVYTPTRDFVLAGVSRQVAIDLCAKLDIPCVEGTVQVQRGMTGDEAFFTSTSLCACPISTINGHAYPAGAPGPITKRIMDAFAEEVGFDYVGQYLKFLGTGPATTGI